MVNYDTLHFCFYLIDFQLYTNSTSTFGVFTVKSHSVTLKIVSKMLLKQSEIPPPIFRKTIGSSTVLL